MSRASEHGSDDARGASAATRSLEAHTSCAVPPWRTGFLAVAVLHLCVALYERLALGVNIETGAPAGTWGFYWQLLPMDLLRTRFFESLWYMHSQPPLFNAYGACMNALFGQHFLQAMQVVNMVLGAALSGMCYVILRHATRRPRLSLCAAFLLALNPPLFLYEAFVLYTLPVAFMVVLCAFLLTLHAECGSRWPLVALVVTLNVLVLTRSLFHLALLVPVIGLCCLLAGEGWRRFLVCSLLISAPALGWYTKNYVQYGFFGASSWLGSNFWRVTARHYDKETLRGFAAEGLISPAAAELAHFDRPLRFRTYGFDKHSEIEALSRDDFHNINMVDISRNLFEGSVRVIRRDPWHYAKNVLEAFQRFCKPSYETRLVEPNAKKIRVHIDIASFFYGTALARGLGELVGVETPSLYSYLIPLVIAVYAARTVATVRRSRASWIEHLRAEPVLAFIVLMVTYVAVVGSLFEYGENFRFKFNVEQLFLCLLVAVAASFIPRGGSRSTAAS